MLLLIAITTCATITLAALAIFQRPPDPVRERARALGRETGGIGRPEDRPFSSRVMLPIGRGLANALLGLLPHRWLRRLDRALVAAGEPVDLGLFALLCVLSCVGGGALGAFWLGMRGVLLLGLLGGAAPLLWLRRTVQRRQRRIQRALPDAIDLLVTCVESGLGLDAALMRVGEATDGPLGDELKITMRQMAMGRPRLEALLDLGMRPNVADLEGLLHPIIQAERSGVSIGAALRLQSESMRVRRRQRAQEVAQKMPVKMTLPVTLFFVPAVLLISVGPVIFSFVDFMERL